MDEHGFGEKTYRKFIINTQVTSTEMSFQIKYYMGIYLYCKCLDINPRTKYK